MFPYTTVTTCIHVNLYMYNIYMYTVCITKHVCNYNNFKVIILYTCRVLLAIVSKPFLCASRCSCNCWCPSDDSQCAHIIMPFSCHFCREGRRVCWPFQDNFSCGIDPFSKSSDLSTLVEQILVVFQNCSVDLSLEKWIALHVSWLKYMYTVALFYYAVLTSC